MRLMDLVRVGVNIEMFVRLCDGVRDLAVSFPADVNLQRRNFWETLTFEVEFGSHRSDFFLFARGHRGDQQIYEISVNFLSISQKITREFDEISGKTHVVLDYWQCLVSAQLISIIQHLEIMSLVFL